MTKRKKGMEGMRRRRLIFYISVVTVPLLQFLVMYIYVNFDSFLLAFQRYETVGPNAGKFIFNGFNNFRAVIENFIEYDYLREGIGRGVLLYLWGVIRLPLEIAVAWYAVKKKPFATAGHVILYVPAVVSGMVVLSITKYMYCDAAPAIVKLLTGKVVPSFLDSGNHMQTFWVIVIDNFLMGITGSLLIYAGAMNGIDNAILEAAELDGVNDWQEFIYIYLPLIASTICTYFILGIGGILTADIGLFAYFGEAAPADLYTLGYYMTLLTKKADNSTYGYLSALGMMLSAILIPLTILGRMACNKITERFE